MRKEKTGSTVKAILPVSDMYARINTAVLIESSRVNTNVNSLGMNGFFLWGFWHDVNSSLGWRIGESVSRTLLD